MMQPAPAPAPAPATTGGSASFAWGGTPGADTTTAADASAPPPLRWRGTTLSATQTVTTTAVGVGRDNVSGDGEYYGWNFAFAPKFFLIDLPKDKLSIGATLGADVELTNGTTVQQRELLLADLPVRLGYSRAAWKSKDGEYATNLSLSGSLTFPTSKASSAQGKYLSTRLGLGATQTVKVLGNDADGLNNVTLGVSGSWGHLFARSYQATADHDLPSNPQDAQGNTVAFDDRLGRNSFSLNTLSISGSFDLPLYGDLSLSTSLGIAAGFKHDFPSSECDVQINTGCVTADRTEDRTLYQPNTVFDVSLGYPVYSYVDLALGYSNESGWIGEDGTRREVLYSPDASFYMTLALNLDAVYSKASGRDKKRVASSASSSSLY